MYESVTKFIDDNLDNSIEDLKTLCRIPSVAAKNEGLEETSALVDKMLKDVGLETKVHETSGLPNLAVLLVLLLISGLLKLFQLTFFYLNSQASAGSTLLNGKTGANQR